MSRILKAGLFGSVALVTAALVAVAANDGPAKPVRIDQNVDQATLDRYHYTDQGTRLVPAAWLAALDKPDGTGKVIKPADLRKYGSLVDNVPNGPANPYGWPRLDGQRSAKSDGIAIAGFTCAMCHTGRTTTGLGDHRGRPADDRPLPLRRRGGERLRRHRDRRVMRKKLIAEAIAAGYPADRMEADFDGVVSDQPHPPVDAGSEDHHAAGRPPGRCGAGHRQRVFGSDLMMPTNQRDATAGELPIPGHLAPGWLQYNGHRRRPRLAQHRRVGTEGPTHIVDADGSSTRRRSAGDLGADQDPWMEGAQTLKAPTAGGHARPDRLGSGRGRAHALLRDLRRLPASDAARRHLGRRRGAARKIGTDPAGDQLSRLYHDLDPRPRQRRPLCRRQAAVNAVRAQLYGDKDPGGRAPARRCPPRPLGYKAGR